MKAARPADRPRRFPAGRSFPYGALGLRNVPLLRPRILLVCHNPSSLADQSRTNAIAASVPAARCSFEPNSPLAGARTELAASSCPRSVRRNETVANVPGTRSTRQRRKTPALFTSSLGRPSLTRDGSDGDTKAPRTKAPPARMWIRLLFRISVTLALTLGPCRSTRSAGFSGSPAVAPGIPQHTSPGPKSTEMPAQPGGSGEAGKHLPQGPGLREPVSPCRVSCVSSQSPSCLRPAWPRRPAQLPSTNPRTPRSSELRRLRQAGLNLSSTFEQNFCTRPAPGHRFPVRPAVLKAHRTASPSTRLEKALDRNFAPALVPSSNWCAGQVCFISSPERVRRSPAFYMSRRSSVRKFRPLPQDWPSEQHLSRQNGAHAPAPQRLPQVRLPARVGGT